MVTTSLKHAPCNHLEEIVCLYLLCFYVVHGIFHSSMKLVAVSLLLFNGAKLIRKQVQC